MAEEKKYNIGKVSIVIPAKDEEANLGKVLDNLNRTLLEDKRDCEIIVVNDNSKDRTKEIALGKDIRVIDNKGRSGKGNALRLGFKESTGDVLVMMDADYSHRPEDLPLFLDRIEQGVGLVIGSRIWGGSEEYTRVRALGNMVLTTIFGLVFHRYLSDVLNGYKVFRRDIFDNFKYSSSTFEIEIELAVNTIRCGYKIMEVPSHERERAGGKAKSRVVLHGTKFLLKIITEGIKFHCSKRAKTK
ncbi:MAG: glycosyltransferase family 2 protein [Candidatus Omnitrophica bacterium]|nr:glycosyltransferase family 2 protein [Candidatus Omnitrophota bacterium]